MSRDLADAPQGKTYRAVEPTSSRRTPVSRNSIVAKAGRIVAVVTACAIGLAIAPPDALAKRKRSSAKKQSLVKKPVDPLLIVISLKRQRVSVFDGTKLVRSSRVSSGKSGHRTPRGIFSILQKNRHHFSNLYNDAPMPFMQRLTWSGIALHQGRVPNYPASHGCIRLPGGFASKLFRMTSYGTRVIVARDPVAPRYFSHDALFKPLPPLNTLVHMAALQPNSAAPPARVGAPISTGSLAQPKSSTTGSSSPGTSARAAPETFAAPPTATAAQQAATTQAPTTDVGALAKPKAKQLWLTRAQLKAGRDARLLDLKAAITDTAALLSDMKRSVAEKRRALKRAGDTATLAKREIRRLKRYEAKALRRARRATQALKSFERRYTNKTFDIIEDAAKITAASLREDELETRYFDLAEDVYAAREDKQAMTRQLKVYRAQVSRARIDLRETGMSAKQALRAARAAKGAYKQALREIKRQNKPIAIFISRKKGRLYIRQGYKPIYDTPVTFTNPDQPIGTHVFTALRFNSDKTDLIWSVVSFDAAVKQVRVTKRGKKRRHITLRTIRAQDALQQIDIPQAARYKIAQLIKPGSSVIISDKRANNETGKHTDFIVSLN